MSLVFAKLHSLMMPPEKTHEILGLIVVFLIWMPLHVETISYFVVTVVISVLIDL